MGSSFGSYQIARSGMQVNERGLYVTGHNIANASTIGYSRQQSISQTSFYHGTSSNMQTGTGAEIQQTRQIRSSFLDTIYRRESQSLGYSEAKNKTYTEIQNILADPMNDGLQSIMNNFWDSWQELSKDPGSLTVRALVRQRGQAFTDYVNNMGTQLKRLQEGLNSELQSDVDEVNDITSQIAELNIEIPRNEASGDRANDLRDQRNVLLDKLTNLMNVEVTEKQNGSVDISIDGYFLVSRDQTTRISLEPHNTEDIGIYYTPKIEGTNYALPVTGGSIKGLMESCMEIVPDIRKQLNTLVNTFAHEVNEIQKTGKTSTGNTGTAFFVVSDNTGLDPSNPDANIKMNNIKLNSNLSDLTNIVTSTAGVIGDNTLAVKMANLRNDLNSSLGNISMDEYYQSLIQNVGNKAEEVSTFTTSQSSLVEFADNQRNSISGVSMDEEMSTMLKYQFAYGGASKVFNAIDEMLNTIVNRMGTVGR